MLPSGNYISFPSPAQRSTSVIIFSIFQFSAQPFQQQGSSRVLRKRISRSIFRWKIFSDDIDPEQYVEENGLKSMNDEGELKATIQTVIDANPQAVEDYHNGKKKAIGALVGQTMKATKGKADPGLVNKLLKEMI